MGRRCKCALNAYCRGNRLRLQPQRRRVAGHLQVAAPHQALVAVKHLAQAFPVNGAGRAAAIQLLRFKHRFYGVKVRWRAHQPLHLVARLAARAFPPMGRLKHRFALDEGVKRAARAERPAVPDCAPRLVPQLKSGQRAAVQHIDAYPVPAHRPRRQQSVAPLMVQPGQAARARRVAAPLQADLPLHRHLRQAVVIAEMLGRGPLARHAALALQQHRLGFGEIQIQRKALGLHLRAQATVTLPGQRPVLQEQAGVFRLRPGLVCGVAASGQARPAGYALVAVQGFTGYVANGGVGKQQVLCGQFGTRALGGCHFAAEKRDLKAQRGRRSARKGAARDVPPLGLKAWVGAKVLRELQGFVQGHPGLRGCVLWRSIGWGGLANTCACRTPGPKRAHRIAPRGCYRHRFSLRLASYFAIFHKYIVRIRLFVNT